MDRRSVNKDYTGHWYVNKESVNSTLRGHIRVGVTNKRQAM